MADRKLINPAIVKDIADAIREKGGTTEQIKVADLGDAVRALPEGGGVGEDTSALLDAVGVESREDTGMANGLAVALTDSATEQMWSGERTTADGAPIKDGVAFVSTLKGKTIKANQLIKRSNDTLRDYSPVVSNSLNGSISVKITGPVSYTAYILLTPKIAPRTITGHTYFLRLIGCLKTKEVLLYNDGGGLRIGKSSAGDSTQEYAVQKCTADNNLCIRIGVLENEPAEYELPIECYDLTDMYGAGNEPSTPEDFARRFGYARVEDMPINLTDTPNLQSFAPKAVVSKGRNLVRDVDKDILSRRGITKDANGNLIGNSVSFYEITNLSQEIWGHLFQPGKRYTFALDLTYESTTSTFFIGFWYADGTKEMVSRISDGHLVITSAKDVVGIRFSYGLSVEVTLSNIMISEGVEEYPYKPYREPSTLNFDLTTIVDAQGNQLFPEDELRSAGSVADMVDYANNVAVKRIGVVDMGSLDWRYIQWNDHMAFRSSVPDALGSTNNEVARIVCAKYTTVTPNDTYIATAKDKTMAMQANPARFYVLDSDYTDATSFKSAMQGVLLYYELAEPIDGEAPLVKSFYPVQNNGTEEAITDSIVPMNADIRYRVDTESLLTQSASLLRYSNEVTGANDSSLGNAVKTLTDNYK